MVWISNVSQRLMCGRINIQYSNVQGSGCIMRVWPHQWINPVMGLSFYRLEGGDGNLGGGSFRIFPWEVYLVLIPSPSVSPSLSFPISLSLSPHLCFSSFWSPQSKQISSLMCFYHDLLPYYRAKNNQVKQPWTETVNAKQPFLLWVDFPHIFCHSGGNLNRIPIHTGFKDRFEQIEEIISNLEDRTIEMTKYEEQKEKDWRNVNRAWGTDGTSYIENSREKKRGKT
jgi:hypothetical protein